MPIALVFAAIDIAFMIHAAKTGRFSPWGYIILMLPGIGAAAYVFVELIPEWLGTYQGQKTQQRIGRALNPEKKYRALVDELHIADTIANRAALAEECLKLGKFGEAKEHFQEILLRPHGDEPIYMFGRARAEFGLDEHTAVVATLDDLRARFPNYQSAEGHLLYARALEEGGHKEAALTEFETLSHYYPGAEPRVRYGLLLQKLGRKNEAREVLADVLKRSRRVPKHVRKAQTEWIALAEKALRI
jgi:hypothetical protein